jgi:hypothetical protein
MVWKGRNGALARSQQQQQLQQALLGHKGTHSHQQKQQGALLVLMPFSKGKEQATQETLVREDGLPPRNVRALNLLYQNYSARMLLQMGTDAGNKQWHIPGLAAALIVLVIWGMMQIPRPPEAPPLVVAGERQLQAVAAADLLPAVLSCLSLPPPPPPYPPNRL